MSNRQKLFSLSKVLCDNGFDDLAYAIDYVAEYKDFERVEELLILIYGKGNF